MVRMLLASNSTASSPPSSSSSSTLDVEKPQTVMIESDFVVILAALLCALICVVGLIAVARCALLRRGNSNNRRSVTNTPTNRGLKKKVVQSLPKYIFDSSSVDAEKQGVGIEATDCAICLTEYVDGEEIRVLPMCGHRFHVQCIDLWLGSHPSCPSCRQILVGVWCQKCGEVPSAAGVNFQAQVPPGSNSSLDCGTSSSSINFNL